VIVTDPSANAKPIYAPEPVSPEKRAEYAQFMHNAKETGQANGPLGDGWSAGIDKSRFFPKFCRAFGSVSSYNCNDCWYLVKSS
jgi:hypothetical protein